MRKLRMHLTLTLKYDHIPSFLLFLSSNPYQVTTFQYNQLEGSSMGEVMLLSSHLYFFFQEWGPLWFFHSLLAYQLILSLSLFRACFYSHIVDMCSFSVIPKRNNLTADFLLQSFLPIPWCFLSLGCRQSVLQDLLQMDSLGSVDLCSCSIL